MEDKKLVKAPHNLIMEDRRNVTITGVSDVDSFDEQMVVVFTDLGELTIKGVNLHINKIDVDCGELTLEGEVDSLTYTNEQPARGGLLSRLFR